jgi:molybdopterin synthase catalytic subunit
MGSALVAIVSDPIDVAAVVRLVEGEPDGGPGRHGAIVTFLGTVRADNAGRRVVELEYEAYEPLALRAFERIVDEARGRWPTVRLAVCHRVGRLRIGETSVAIAAASPHRAEAFAACRYTIERVKQIAPIWKREVFEGGEVWIEGATADPDDEAAREQAYRRACA